MQGALGQSAALGERAETSMRAMPEAAVRARMRTPILGAGNGD